MCVYIYICIYMYCIPVHMYEYIYIYIYIYVCCIPYILCNSSRCVQSWTRLERSGTTAALNLPNSNPQNSWELLSPSSLFFASLEVSDPQVYEPQIRAFLNRWERRSFMNEPVDRDAIEHIPSGYMRLELLYGETVHDLEAWLQKSLQDPSNPKPYAIDPTS